MTERNSKKCRIILMFALPSFNSMTYANYNDIITNISKTEDVIANDDIKSQKTNKTKCFSKPLKAFLVTSLAASIPILFGKDCYDYFCYKKALKEAKNYAIKIVNKVQRETVNNKIDSIVRLNFSWPFKTILLKLIKMEECYNLVCLLHSRLQNISYYDQKTKFNFIITDEFIKYYKNFKYDNVLENVRTCLRFVNSYL